MIITSVQGKITVGDHFSLSMFTMASSTFYSSFFLLLLLFLLSPSQAAGAGGELIYEDGYTVTTVLDGDKSNLKVNPHSILHQSPPSDLFILLDKADSVFYTVSLPTTSNQTVIKKLAGKGEAGYTDGDLGSARFKEPKSFAVDLSGNIYVADQRNHAIRKITKSGVTTIAGGYSQKIGRADGPGRDASFSNDLELTFIPERCALMISDRGSRLVRQINLKAADCTRYSGSVLGTTSAWFLGLGLSCLLGLIIGLVMRPYIIPHEVVKPLHSHCTWTHCLTSLERQIATLLSDIRNAIVKSMPYSLFWQFITLSISLLSLMFRAMIIEPHSTREKPISLLDLDEVPHSHSSSNLVSSPEMNDQLKESITFDHSSSSSSSSLVLTPEMNDQLKELIPFDGGPILPANTNEVVVQQEVEEESSDVSRVEHDQLDSMLLANLANFEEQANRVCSDEVVGCNSLGLIKRR